MAAVATPVAATEEEKLDADVGLVLSDLDELPPADAVAADVGVVRVDEVVPVDPEQEELLQQLRRVVGGGSLSTKESLRAALRALTKDEPAATGAPETPPAPDPGRPAGPPEPAAATGSATGSAAAAGAPPIDYARFMDSQGFGLVIMDTSGRFVQWNSTVQNLLGYSAASMETLSMMHVTPAEDLPEAIETLSGILQAPALPTLSSPVVMNKRCVTRGGEDLRLTVRMGVFKNGGLPLLSCLIDCHGPHMWELPVRWSGAPTAEAHQPALGPPPARKRRVPLPTEAVNELRSMLAWERYPSPEARQELAQRHGLERRRVDRWLENTRAREGQRSKGVD